MKFTIFGESHGPAVGVTLEGVPAGLEIDGEFLRRELARRAPAGDGLSTARREADEVRFLSGVYEGHTTGTPLCAVIENGDQHSGDYEALRTLARPGHADYTGWVRYGGYNDPRGGGHFSGRLTAPLVAAGAVAKLILAPAGVEVFAHIASIGGVEDTPFDPVRPDLSALRALRDKAFPVLDGEKGALMKQEILSAREQLDSVGGSVECLVSGLEAGMGAPDFGRNAEGIFSQYLFAVPAVKGVEFGAGFAFADMRGTEANDPFCIEEGEIRTRTNHNGGINGGITNGMPVVFRAAFKPTPSIAQAQATVDFAAFEETTVAIRGRHDPCIVHRAVPVVEAAAALAACELMGF